ncbi:dTDP-4-dehydrorhamnose reductase [Burkholderia multivorans]|uniref:dTDP-4-dehydrorhamnose reductase n=1 Tax=Burkholderia multivorans TaxID=87883 RepID=UPI001C2277F8|nr:dTDP-4-dehydrorhamnose reductase [Burkholderia multivorans]MBU9282747.1 dTDP-4-dehydrorhamnose reductase [Burkholderia multivorans]MCL4660911.1 dTDP-4-dehydrorhamnose reductase [Burkholderia multivorans]MCO1352345.1 dTDP-4-dehydrorhamnose reductase [Burkholderia multivorans]MCO1413811.1 dTDP-4-dehydrorhamnose reductase [Burkholderia multivorans]MCO1445999.1 dTDP-4-dehydrorhamnose reductase [Burkholderia multivorans]
MHFEDPQRSRCRILVTGVQGQVGFELVRALQGLGEIVAPDRSTLDIGNFDQIRAVVREVRPSLIINPAAYTAVDAAEHDADTAMRINGLAPGVLAEEAKRLNAALIHYSTDYVFDGTKTSSYTEDDATNPQNVYGQTKLAGEHAIFAVAPNNALVFRTSWVYGARGRNFLLTMLRLGSERSELRVVADQVGAPTWSNTIAAMTAHVVAQARCAPDAHEWWRERSGVYHLTAAGQTSWHGFASAIFELAELPVRPTVLPISASDYPTPAKRPSNSRLSNDKFVRQFGLMAPDWRESLHLCLREALGK